MMLLRLLPERPLLHSCNPCGLIGGCISTQLRMGFRPSLCGNCQEVMVLFSVLCVTLGTKEMRMPG